MLDPEKKKRLQNIYAQLYEVANGNFSFQIARTNHKDELEALSALVNLVTQEIKDSFLHEGYINFRNTYSHTTQTILVLDKRFKIIECHDSFNFLGYKPSEFIGESLEHLLTNASIKNWRIFNRQYRTKKTIKLYFKTKQNLIFKAQCYCITFHTHTILKDLTILTTFDLVKSDNTIKLNTFKNQPKNQSRSKHILSAQDIENIRFAGTFIIDHLEQDSPTLKDMSHTFGINEFKLKKGFKQLYGMTVFQFLKTERLKKGHILVQHSTMSFKEIAKTVGFKTASHFSREFYNHYKYRPKTLRLNS
ncbi:AraC family transcriptional regulator [uncultured Formosa sp.]|uniref:helix-turn-helix domain-containing protein n=1 Tax=uncultured Formosa sp. TaxID=255435 RepID=UPI00261C5A55|nr:AraC family transcriptional regulator [uncultured Formosa sp.]